MPEIKINPDDAYDLMLQSLKPLAETVMEEELDFVAYVERAAKHWK